MGSLRGGTYLAVSEGDVLDWTGTDQNREVAVVVDIVPDIVTVGDRRDGDVTPGQQGLVLHSLRHHPGDHGQTSPLLTPAGLTPS